MSNRPKSMSDFTSLLDASIMPPPLHPYDKSRENSQHSQQHPRKKPSISLAAGLIMASAETSSPRSFGNGHGHTSSSGGSYSNKTGQQENGDKSRGAEGWSEGLFYAYAQKDTPTPSPPTTLTFSSALVASHWWSLVQAAYPSSTRPSPQFFILRTSSSTPSPSSYPDPIDPLVQIQQHPHFAHLQNKWFFSTPQLDVSTSTISPLAIIPLQDARGYPLQASPPPQIQPQPVQPTERTEDSNLSAFTTALSTLTTLTTENTTQIRALSIAQSTGLTTMQQFHETTTSQIQTLTSSQSSLQSMLNSTTATTSTLKSVQSVQKGELAEQAKRMKTMAETQKILLETSAALVSTIDALTTRIQNLPTSATAAAAPVQAPPTPPSRPTTPLRSKSNSFALSDTSTLMPSSPPMPFPTNLFPQTSQQGTIRTRISPPPRKLNRRVKGVWYEYDTTPIVAPTGTVSANSKATASIVAKSIVANATGTPSPKATTTPRSVPSFDVGNGKSVVLKGSGAGVASRPTPALVKAKA